MSFIAGIGKTNIDLLYADIKKLPAAGEEVYTEHFSVKLGGGLPGTLVNLARLGIPVKLGTFLGEDMFSAFAAEEYRKNNVAVSRFPVDNAIPVNITSAVILPEDRAFISYGAPEAEYTDAEKERFYALAKGAAICYMESPALYEVYCRLHKEGTTLVYDTGWDDALCFEKYEKMLSLADYYVPNQKEAMKLTGTASPEAAAQALRRYFQKVVVKLDKDGCLGMDGDGSVFTVKAIDAFQCVDSTGAGDAFLAGFLYGLYHGYSFKKCILCGNITGGKAVTQIGALSAYCTEEELLQRLREYQYLL